MTNKQERIITLLIISIVIIGVAFFTWRVVSNKKLIAPAESPAVSALKSEVGQSSYTDIDGNTVLLSDYIGNVLVVNSWASWCPACGQELKKLTSLADEYQGKDVVFLAINRAEPINTAVSYLKAIDKTGQVKLILDPGDRYFNSIDGYNMPETVIYDREGNIALHRHGVTSTLELKDKLDRLQSQ